VSIFLTNRRHEQMRCAPTQHVEARQASQRSATILQTTTRRLIVSGPKLRVSALSVVDKGAINLPEGSKTAF
jgi:hypothetical protein